MSVVAAKKIPKFKKWLEANGAEMLQPTNEWEVLRFRCGRGVGVLYQNKQGQFKANDDMVYQAYKAFKGGGSFDLKVVKTSRTHTNRRNKSQIRRRDGNECFYCGKPFKLIDLSLEHVVSLLHGGPNRTENMVLACFPCNQEAGHMSVIDKVKLRESKRNK